MDIPQPQRRTKEEGQFGTTRQPKTPFDNMPVGVPLCQKCYERAYRLRGEAQNEETGLNESNDEASCQDNDIVVLLGMDINKYRHEIDDNNTITDKLELHAIFANDPCATGNNIVDFPEFDDFFLGEHQVVSSVTTPPPPLRALVLATAPRWLVPVASRRLCPVPRVAKFRLRRLSITTNLALVMCQRVLIWTAACIVIMTISSKMKNLITCVTLPTIQ